MGLPPTKRKCCGSTPEWETTAPTSQQKFRALGDSLYELKSGAHRLFCFFQPGGRLVMTHGYRKQRQKADQREIERARRLWAQYERNRSVR